MKLFSEPVIDSNGDTIDLPKLWVDRCRGSVKFNEIYFLQGVADARLPRSIYNGLDYVATEKPELGGRIPRTVVQSLQDVYDHTGLDVPIHEAYYPDQLINQCILAVTPIITDAQHLSKTR